MVTSQVQYLSFRCSLYMEFAKRMEAELAKRVPHSCGEWEDEWESLSMSKWNIDRDCNRDVTYEKAFNYVAFALAVEFILCLRSD